MASLPQLPNDVPLSGPPPNPVNGPATPSSGAPQFGGIPGTPVQAPKEDQTSQFLLQAGMEIDANLKKMSQAFPKGGPKFSQAGALIQAGIADALSNGPGAVTTSPTATGPNFTGTGGL